MKRIRKLFIVNSASQLGGANRSLRNLIINLNEKVDLMVPKGAGTSDQVIRNYFGSNINKIYRFYLPFRMSYNHGDSKGSLLRWWLETEVVYRKNRKKIVNVILANKYDYVHLNSYVLYPLVTKKYPTYIHVREICRANPVIKKLIQAKIRNAKGIIYIDESTKAALGIEKNSIVINNPFNQKPVLDVDTESVRNKYCIKEMETVFSFISASVSSEKGMSFIADAFVKADCQNAKLLMVGVKKVPKYKKYPNIIFVGSVSKMEEIYAVTDYVLRGESQFCIGRTTYEGLYSGCGVIIPGIFEKDSKKMFEYDKFKDKIYFYEPRNKESLINILHERIGKRKNEILGLSNVEEYVKQFNEFISNR